MEYFESLRWSLSILNAKLRPILEILEKAAEDLEPASRLLWLDSSQLERECRKKDLAQLGDIKSVIERLDWLEEDFKRLESIMADIKVIIDSNTRLITKIDKETKQ
jgi:chromosome segregation ATPase